MTAPAMRRRDILGAAAVAAAAAGLLGGGLVGGPADAAAQGPADVSIVVQAIELQLSLSVAYGAMADRPRLGGSLRALLRDLSAQERLHAQALETLAEFLGARPSPTPTLGQVEEVLPGVRRAVDRPSGLAVLDELERAELLGFYTDVQVLGDAKLIETAAAVMCSDAQHLVLVRQEAGLDPIPAAFETGSTR